MEIFGSYNQVEWKGRGRRWKGLERERGSGMKSEREKVEGTREGERKWNEVREGEGGGGSRGREEVE